ncbi:MAG: DUF5777 family beta-barrel protein [Vicinamibacterales bacterium]
MRTLTICLAALTWALAAPRPADAQTASDGGTPVSAAAPAGDSGHAADGPGSSATADPATPSPAQATDDDDAFNPAEPEFTVVNLPTTLRLPTHKLAFRVAHRFTRPLGAGDFGDLASDFFGIDSGAAIGLELRFSPIKGGQIGFHRNNSKTIEFFGQYSLLRQRTAPVSIDALVTIEGTNNFQDSKTPVVGAVISRTVRDVAAIYAIPMFVNNSNPLPKELVDDNNTLAIGLGARIRISRSAYLVGEVTPRASGFAPGSTGASFGIEKRVGRHMFQLNFSNHLGTTLGEVTRGAGAKTDWYMGFNIYRKFF